MYPDFRILIVDDFALIRSMMRQSLGQLGFTNLTEAVDGLDALQKIETSMEHGQPFSVVFLDWNMPRMTGLELIEHCKATPALSNLPFVMISAERDPESVVRALEAGAMDFIAKPFSPENLHTKLRKLLLEEEAAQDDLDDPEEEEELSAIRASGN
jgi:two-component system, chemotaxis family, chemotaxis protein CheY